MPFPNEDGRLTRELEVASGLARRAGAAAMVHYGTATARAKAGGSPVTAADHAANAVIVGGLRESFPEDGILSEESLDSADRLARKRVWVVDPLDGTKEFLARNGEFAVMIGLVVEGEPWLGVLYLPDPGILYRAVRGEGAWAEEDGGRLRRLRTAPAANGRPLRLVGSRSHPDALLLGLQRALGIDDVRPSGSVGVKCALIAEAERDLYVHPVAFLREWDTAAPEVVLREAGGHVTDCLGQPLRYNKPDPRQPHGIVACAAGALEPVLRILVPLYRESLEST